MKFNTLLVGATLLGLSGLAHAQPDVNNAAKAENPANRPVGGGRGGQGGGRNTLTPEIRQQMVAQGLKRVLTQAGFTDTALQDAVVDFAKDQDDATQPLQEKLRQITQALRGDTVTEPQLMSLLNSFRAAVDDEKARREKALKDLDAKIGFSKKPKLDALLLTLGLTGEEAAIANGGLAGGRGGLGGFGGGGFGGGGNFGGGAGGFGGGGGFGGAGGFGGQGGRGGQDGRRPAAPIGPNGGFNF